MNRIDLPARARILVMILRRLGDVLLTTPLIRSLRRAWPDATIDALVDFVTGRPGTGRRAQKRVLGAFDDFLLATGLLGQFPTPHQIGWVLRRC